MTKIRNLTVGSLVGVTLTLGLGGIASAANAAPAGVTATSTPVSSTPATPSTPTPSSPPPSSSPSRTHVLPGNEIWRIVHPKHGIDCARANKQVKRVQVADGAAGKRLTRWKTESATDQARRGKNAATRIKTSSGKVRGFQKLQNDGQALIKRIEAKCPAASAAA